MGISKSPRAVKKYNTIWDVIGEYWINIAFAIILILNKLIIDHYIRYFNNYESEILCLNIIEEYENINGMYKNINNCIHFIDFIFEKMIFGRKIISILWIANLIVIVGGLGFKFVIGLNQLKSNIISPNFYLLEIINLILFGLYSIPSAYYYSILFADIKHHPPDIADFYLLINSFFESALFIFVPLLIIGIFYRQIFGIINKITFIIDKINNLLKTQVEYVDYSDPYSIDKIV